MLRSTIPCTLPTVATNHQQDLPNHYICIRASIDIDLSTFFFLFIVIMRSILRYLSVQILSDRYLSVQYNRHSVVQQSVGRIHLAKLTLQFLPPLPATPAPGNRCFILHFFEFGYFTYFLTSISAQVRQGQHIGLFFKAVIFGLEFEADMCPILSWFSHMFSQYT